MSRALVGRRHLLRSGTFIVAVLACGVWCAAVATGRRSGGAKYP